MCVVRDNIIYGKSTPNAFLFPWPDASLASGNKIIAKFRSSTAPQHLLQMAIKRTYIVFIAVSIPAVNPLVSLEHIKRVSETIVIKIDIRS